MATDFHRQLKSEDILPVYALVGSSSILVDEAVGALRSKVLTQAADFNRDELRAEDTDAGEILAAIQTLPMMAPRRWVHVARVHKLKAEVQETLAAYVKKPVPHTVLVLSGEKIDRRRKLGQALSKRKAMFGFEAPKPWELNDWIETRAEHVGHPIERDAAVLLGEFVGVDVGTIDRALETLDLYAGGDRPISEADVEDVVAPTRVRSIFELTDAIGERNRKGATRLLRNALDGGESGLLVLAMIARHLRQLLSYLVYSAQRLPHADLARAIGVKPFLLNRIAEQARNFSIAQLRSGLHAAARADVALKGSGLAPGVVLERLLLDLVDSQ